MSKELLSTALVALLLSACTAQPVSGIPTATKPSEQAAPPTKEPAPLSDFDKALRFTRCMTVNGITTKDPVAGEVLPIWMTVSEGEGADSFQQRSIAHRAAWNKCKSLLPATWPVKEDPAQLAKERPFKDCLKRHGIEVYEADSNGMVHYPVDQSYLDTPEYNAAVDACRKFYDDPANAGGS